MTTREEDCAWAAGFFDGEGSTSNFRSHYGKDGKASIYVRLHVGQKHPAVLRRFHAIVGVGHTNERLVKGVPFYDWHASSYHDVLIVQNLLRFHLGEVKQQQMSRCISSTTLMSGRKKEQHTA